MYLPLDFKELNYTALGIPRMEPPKVFRLDCCGFDHSSCVID